MVDCNLMWLMSPSSLHERSIRLHQEENKDWIIQHFSGFTLRPTTYFLSTVDVSSACVCVCVCVRVRLCRDCKGCKQSRRCEQKMDPVERPHGLIFVDFKFRLYMLFMLAIKLNLLQLCVRVFVCVCVCVCVVYRKLTPDTERQSRHPSNSLKITAEEVCHLHCVAVVGEIKKRVCEKRYSCSSPLFVPEYFTSSFTV
ncbi:hypothetical protein INR49_025818 [Caranx melampygus]|nr:hypothetical protein INR49_025818 [Caranx melampygus]